MTANPQTARSAAPAAEEAPPLLRVEGLKVHFPIRRGVLQRQVGAVKAVDGISFNVRQGETLGLVGESGCGNRPPPRDLAALSAHTGRVFFEGEPDGLKANLRRKRRRIR
jgi:ABC-type microcin C transport system duplicated ATPase subunit YejF